jgi:hypothetical protein
MLTAWGTQEECVMIVGHAATPKECVMIAGGCAGGAATGTERTTLGTPAGVRDQRYRSSKNVCATRKVYIDLSV